MIAALPQFDDPNIDKDAAIVGILGTTISALEYSPLSFFLTEDDSPYPEVRSAVANTDDPSIPASTFRAWTLGLIWAIIIPVRVSGCQRDAVSHPLFIGSQPVLLLPVRLGVFQQNILES